MSRFTRRRFVGLTAGGLTALALPAGGTRPDAVAGAIATIVLGDVEGVLARATALLKAGLRPTELLSALFHAPFVHASDRGDVHMIMVIDALRRLTAPPVRRSDRLISLLWAAENTCTWTRKDPIEPLRRGAAPPLVDALAARDPDAAERSALAALTVVGVDGVGRALTLASAAVGADPHRAIFVAQCLRSLRVFGHDYAPFVVRSMARRLATSEASPPPESALTLPAGWTQAPPDPAALPALLEALRSPGAAPVEVFADLLASGVGPSTAWDALSLLAVDGALADAAPTGMGVHGLSLLDALRFAWDDSPNDVSRWRVLRGAAHWMVDLWSALPPGPSVLQIAPPAADLPRDAPFAPGSRLERLTRGRVVAGLPGFAARARERICASAANAHDFKAASALIALAESSSGAVRRTLKAGLALSPALVSPDAWPRRDEARRLVATL